ncbi:MAG: hypothetical protein OXP71_00595 [Candidatus Poribacteria bacterium]|nr:hypothetical protein [Candidatus Poribacteria bacterium]
MGNRKGCAEYHASASGAARCRAYKGRWRTRGKMSSLQDVVTGGKMPRLQDAVANARQDAAPTARFGIEQFSLEHD